MLFTINEIVVYETGPKYNEFLLSTVDTGGLVP